MSTLSKDDRMKLAIKAWENGQYKSKFACTKAFDVPPRTFYYQIGGRSNRRDKTANYQKLLNIKKIY